MALFVISCLALFVIVFLLTVAAQAIKIERTAIDSARFMENWIAKMYQGEEEL